MWLLIKSQPHLGDYTSQIPVSFRLKYFSNKKKQYSEMLLQEDPNIKISKQLDNLKKGYHWIFRHWCLYFPVTQNSKNDQIHPNPVYPKCLSSSIQNRVSTAETKHVTTTKWSIYKSSIPSNITRKPLKRMKYNHSKMPFPSSRCNIQYLFICPI